MILNSIELENIRSYQHEKIEFPRGITLFEGDIGSGKSSVLMGIEFALFGLGSQKPEALLAKKAEDGEVTLIFEVDEQKYEIRRRLKRKGNSVGQDPKGCHLIYNGQKEPLSPSELKQRVLHILKFNEPEDPRSESRIFRYAVFTPQEEMKQILRDSTRRLETIRKAFGIEDYKTVIENARNVSSIIKEQMVRFKERFSNIDKISSELEKEKSQIDVIEKNLGKLTSEETVLKNKEKEKQTELEKIQGQLQEKRELEIQEKNISSTIKEKKLDIRNIQDQIEDNEKDLEEIKEKISELEKIKKPTTKTIPQIENEIKEFRKLKSEIDSLQSKIESLTDDLSELDESLGEHKKQNVEQLKNKLQKLKEAQKKGEGERKKLEKLKEKQNEEKIKHEQEKKNLEEEISQVMELGSKCPICEQSLSLDKKEKLEKKRTEKIQKVKTELRKISDELKQTLSRLQQIESKESSLEEQISELEDIIPDLEDWSKKSASLESFSKQMKNLKSRFEISEEKAFLNKDEFEDTISYLGALKDALIKYENSEGQIGEFKKRESKTSKLIASYNEQIKDLQKNISKLESQLDDLLKKKKTFEGLDEKIQDVKQDLSELRDKIDDNQRLIAATSENLKNHKKVCEKLENDLSQAKIWQKEHQRFSDYYGWLVEYFIPSVDQIEKQVLHSIWQNFNEVYRRWYSILIDDVTKESRIDEEFSPIVEQDGFEQDVDFLSGGEKTSIALAYRLTLNSLMRKETESLKSNLLILDEPTDGFSKTQLSKVRELLQELQSQQIILVSHEKELETYVDNIFQIAKDAGISHVVRLNN